MAYNRNQQELSPSASPIKKKSKPPTASDMVDKMANTVTHFEDILRTELTRCGKSSVHTCQLFIRYALNWIFSQERRENKRKLSQITIDE